MRWVQLCGSLSILRHCLSLGLEWKLTDLFQFCGHCWVFQICWHIACSTFTASSFRIWNSLIGIPSPPLSLFIAMLPKAHLTLHSRMSGSRLVITPLWLSGSLRSFLYSSSSLVAQLLKNMPAMWETWFDPWLGRSPGEGYGYSLQYSGLENSMDCLIHGVAKSQTWLRDFHFTV